MKWLRLSLLGILLKFHGLPLMAQNLQSLILADRANSQLLEFYDTLTPKQWNTLSGLLEQEIKTTKPLKTQQQYHGRLCVQLAQFHTTQTQFDSSFFYLNRAFEIFNQHRYWSEASFVMYRIGTLYSKTYKFEESISQYLSTLLYNELHQVDTYTGHVYNLLSLDFQDLGDSKNEEKYMLKFIDFAEKKNKDSDKIYAYELWATALDKKKLYQPAYEFHLKALHLVRKGKFKEGADLEGEILTYIAKSLLHMKKYSEARQTINLAEKIISGNYLTPNRHFNLSSVYQTKAEILLATHQHKQALKYAKSAHKLLKGLPPRQQLLEVLTTHINVLKATEQHNKALQVYEEMRKVETQLSEENDLAIIKTVEAKFQLENKEKEKELFRKTLEIKELELEKGKREKGLFWGIVAVGLFLLFFMLLSYYQVNRLNRALSERSKQLQSLNDTKDKLFGILGHDLRRPLADMNNTLQLAEHNVMSAHLLIPLLRKKLTLLENLLTNLLYWALSQQNTLRINPRHLVLLDSINDILPSLEGMIKEKELKVLLFESSQNFIYVDENHLTIILSNLIHNAIKFSLLGGSIQVTITDEPSHVLCTIHNTGQSFEWDGEITSSFNTTTSIGTSNEKGTGLGLLVCAELVKLNKGTIRAYPNPTEGGTTLELTFPTTKSDRASL